MITREKFAERVGRDPEGDELEICNCTLRPEVGHWVCGWEDEADLPFFMTDERLQLSVKIYRCATIVEREIKFEGRPRNYYEPPYRTMITSGEFWRCFHGVTRFVEGGCPDCARERPELVEEAS